jgi:peptidoglycan/xylan/chitin deacetylase (PgdA/CDA1 family)
MYPGGAQFCLSLTYDVEMCTNFPYWTSVWDHRKGAIDEDSKLYILKLNEVAKKYGAKLHFFLVGSALEDPHIDYLKQLVDAGHAIGNHTYTHVFVKAKTVQQLQVVYRNAPWRAAGRTPLECIRNELRETNLGVREKLGVELRGFRTPGGFANGLHDVPEVQDLLKQEGFAYASSHYSFPVDPKVKHPPREQLECAMRQSLDTLQPYRYPNGLLEIAPMGITDIWAFRYLDLDRWEYINLLKVGIDHAHANRQVLTLTFHPPCLAARDPHCDVLETVLHYALAQPGGCWIATNDDIEAHVRTN